jgi:hypothetical protein
MYTQNCSRLADDGKPAEAHQGPEPKHAQFGLTGNEIGIAGKILGHMVRGNRAAR